MNERKRRTTARTIYRSMPRRAATKKSTLAAVRAKIGRLRAADKKTIDRLRMADLTPHIEKPDTLSTRLLKHLARIYSAEIERRHAGPVTIPGEESDETLKVCDRHNRIVLLKASGWHYYSKSFGSRYQTIAYLCGRDDNGTFARRVPSTCTTIAEAIAALEPADIKRARDNGQRVWRQGDLYAVQVKRNASDTSYAKLPRDVRASHKWNSASRILTHASGHRHIRFGKIPIKFVLQNITRAGSSNAID